MQQQIGKGVIKGLVQIGEETGKELINEVGKISETIITGKELLGDIVPMSNQEMTQKQNEEEQKKQKEMADLKNQMSEHGRNVEGEINQVRQEKEQKEKEEEEERLFLENIKRQREEERMETGVMEPPSRKKSRGSAFGGKAKKEDMSATKEYVKKPD